MRLILNFALNLINFERYFKILHNIIKYYTSRIKNIHKDFMFLNYNIYNMCACTLLAI